MSATIRLCTWNVQLGMQLDSILRALKQYSDFSGLDLFALQEVSTHHRQEDARLIAAVLGPQYAYYQVLAHFLGERAQANALIWNTERARVVDTDSVKLPHMREVKLSRTERTLLRALPMQQRISVRVEGIFESTAETWRVYVAHLDVVGFAHKREQFDHILADARARAPVDLQIIAGDLNTFKIRSRPSWSQLIAAAQANGFKDLTSEIRWTHAVRRLRWKQKLDAIFVAHAKPMQYRSWSLDIPGSDHIPVFADMVVD